MVDAILTVWLLILREKAEASSLWRKVPVAFRIRIAKVVVFIPPAVDPGDPPISISTMLRNLPASVKFVVVRSVETGSSGRYGLKQRSQDPLFEGIALIFNDEE